MVQLALPSSGPPLAITAHSMVTSLGLDAATSASAARAGIRRAQPLDYYEFRTPDGREPEFAIGHPVPIITHGFESPGRLVQLAKAALKGLPVPTAAHPRRGGLYLALPSFNRPWTMLDRIPDPQTRKTWEEERDEEVKTPEEDDDAARDLIRKVTDGTVWQQVPVRFISRSGKLGSMEALAVAWRDLGRGELDWAVLGGIDSLLDWKTLSWLEATGRLKTQSNPMGTEPGEAAALYVLTRNTGSIRRQSNVTLLAAAVGRPRDISISIAATVAKTSGLCDVLMYCDHTGEAAAATAFSSLISNLHKSDVQSLRPLLLYPSAFGDTNGSSGAVGACFYLANCNRLLVRESVGIVAVHSDGNLGALAIHSSQMDN